MNEQSSDTAGATDGRGGYPKHWMLLFNAVTKFLLAVGIPLRPFGVLTVRGRKSGQPRKKPLAIVETKEGRWVWSPFGDEQRVRNLRGGPRNCQEGTLE